MAATVVPFSERLLTEKGTYIFTLTSNGYKFMTLNFLRHLQELRVRWTPAVYCSDAASYRFFLNEGFKAFKLEPLLPDTGAQIIPFGSRQFQTLNRKKLDLLAALVARPEIRQGIYLDGDIIPYADFVPDIEQRLTGPGPVAAPLLLMQCDERTRVACTRNLTSEKPTPCPFMCSGVIAWRYGLSPDLFSLSGRVAATTWVACPEDQVFINRRIPEFLDLAAVETLPRNLYPNGSFSSLPTHRGRSSGTLLLHYNYLVGDAKRGKMKANGDWIIPY